MPDAIPQDARDYFRSVERRIMRLERRGTPNTVQSVLGPGLASQAVRIMDWNSRDTTLNGFYYSGVGSINSPDSELTWTGQVIAKDDGTGMQQVWNTDGPTTQYWMRTYAPTPETEDENVIFSGWKKFATASGLIGVDEIDPDFVDSLPAPEPTDGTPVTVGPVVTPIGGIGSMFFRWTEVTNADPVTYRLHVRADATPTTDGTYEVAAGVGITYAAVRTLKDGAPIVGDGSVVYHAIVTAEDADNAVLPTPPGASAEVTGIPAQVTSGDIATNAVTTNMLVFNDGWGINLTGEIITGATFQTRSTPERGIKIGTINGIESQLMYRDDGSIFFKAVPSEGMAILDGEAKLNSLTVAPTSAEEGTSLGGVTEIVRHADGSAGVLRLTGYTTPPKSAPTVTTSYDTVQFTDDGLWGSRRGWTTDGTNWFTTRDTSAGWVVEKWSPAGVLLDTGGGGAGDPASCVIGGGYLWVLGGDSTTRRLHRFNLATLAEDWWWLWTQNDGARNPALGFDSVSGELLIAQSRASNADKVRVRRYAQPVISDPLTAGAFVDTDFAYDGDLAGVTYGAHDFGANRYVLAKDNATSFQVTSSTGALVAAEEWQSGMAAKVGFAYTGGVFKSMDTSGLMRTYTAQDKATAIGHANLTKYVSNTLATATLETTQSPRAKITIPKRTKINVTTSAINTGGTNAPDRVHIYIAQNTATPAADPGNTNMILQADPAVGVTTKTYSAIATSPDTNPPTTNGFAAAAGTIQRLELADETLFVNGIGDGSVGTGTFRTSVQTASLDAIRPVMRRHRAITQSIPDSTFTRILFTTLDRNSGITATNSGTSTITRAGEYNCHVQIPWAGNATGRRTITFRVNGVEVTRTTALASGINTTDGAQDFLRQLNLAVNDTFEVWVWQNSTAALNVLGDTVGDGGGASVQTFLDIHYIGG